GGPGGDVSCAPDGRCAPGGGAAAWPQAPADVGIFLRTEPGARTRLCLQACADAGGSLSVPAPQNPAALPCADCGGPDGTVARDRDAPARTPGASLHASWLAGASAALLAARRAVGSAALGQPGSVPTPDHGPDAAGHTT